MLHLALLGLYYSLFAMPQTISAILINSTLNAAPSDPLDNVLPVAVCVNNTQHPMWGVSLELFDFSECRRALAHITAKLEGNYYTSYDFYSRRVYPSGPGPIRGEAWPLAQGAGSG